MIWITRKPKKEEVTVQNTDIVFALTPRWPYCRFDKRSQPPGNYAGLVRFDGSVIYGHDWARIEEFDVPLQQWGELFVHGHTITTPADSSQTTDSRFAALEFHHGPSASHRALHPGS